MLKRKVRVVIFGLFCWVLACARNQGSDEDIQASTVSSVSSQPEPKSCLDNENGKSPCVPVSKASPWVGQITGFNDNRNDNENSNYYNALPDALGDEMTDQQAVESAMKAFQIQAILGTNQSLDAIKSDLPLLPEGKFGTSVLWIVKNPNISAEGRVSQPVFGKSPVVGKLILQIKRGTTVMQKDYLTVVVAQDPTDEQAVLAALDSIMDKTILGKNIDLSEVQNNLALPSEGPYQTVVQWSGGGNFIDASGIVSRPSFYQADATVNLSATVKKGAVSHNKVFAINLLHISLPEIIVSEVFAGDYYSNGMDDAWVEVFNGSANPVLLSRFQLRTCDRSSTCESSQKWDLPAITLDAGGYILLHADLLEKTFVDGKTDIYLPGFSIHQTFGFIELMENDKTVDFVRWSASASEVGQPLIGSFIQNVSTQGDIGKQTFGRKFPYTDNDSYTDWVFYQFSTPGGPNNGLDDPNAVDSDADGLSDQDEIDIYQTNPHVADTDGDGFSDGQEISDFGVAGVNIKAFGAHPLVRDIFVEVDYMEPPLGSGDNAYDSTTDPLVLSLRKDALTMVKNAFAAYVPDANDANQFPIKVHFDVGDVFDNSEGLSMDNYDLGGGNPIPFSRCVCLGFDETRTADNCVDLYQLKQQHFDIARTFVFHYLVLGWSQEADGAMGSSGIAEYQGNDLIVSIGNWSMHPDIDVSAEYFIKNIQAAVIMHELGHNLGLNHGGNDSINYKPNYSSIMNYLYQLTGLDHNRNGDVYYFKNDFYNYGPASAYQYREDLDLNPFLDEFLLDFSYGKEITLDEAALDEQFGWGGGAVDFNNDGVIATTPIQFDINPLMAVNPALSNEQLSDYDDWGNVDLQFQRHFSGYQSGALGLSADFDRQPVIRERIIYP